MQEGGPPRAMPLPPGHPCVALPTHTQPLPHLLRVGRELLVRRNDSQNRRHAEEVLGQERRQAAQHPDARGVQPKLLLQGGEAAGRG